MAADKDKGAEETARTRRHGKRLALKAMMVEGHGPVEGLLAAVYFGDVDETKEGHLKYQLLRLVRRSF